MSAIILHEIWELSKRVKILYILATTQSITLPIVCSIAKFGGPSTWERLDAELSSRAAHSRSSSLSNTRVTVKYEDKNKGNKITIRVHHLAATGLAMSWEKGIELQNLGGGFGF